MAEAFGLVCKKCCILMFRLSCLQVFCPHLVAIIVSVAVGKFTGGSFHEGNNFLGGKLSK